MTHLNFSVEQHGGIYILLSGNVSTFFSSSNIEKILNTLFQNTNVHMHMRAHTHRYATHFWKQTSSLC